MLDAREMDAVIIPQPPPSSFMKGSPKVARLFPNYREVEMAYYKTTGHFPTMHTIAIKRSVYDANLWPRLT